MAARASVLALLLSTGPACWDAAVAGGAVEAWAYPLTLTQSELSAACGPGRDWLDHWTVGSLGHDPAADAVSGYLDTGYDVWLRSPESLADNARVAKASGSGIRCTGVDIDVYSPSDGTTRHIRDKDLNWQGALDSGNGVITLDSAHYWAVVPGLKVGDRLRVVTHQEWARSHHMPVIALHGKSGGASHVSVNLTVPNGGRMRYELVGASALCKNVVFGTVATTGGEVASWEYRDAARTGGDTDDDDVLLLVTHAAVDESALKSTTFDAAPDWERAARGYRERVEPFLAPSDELKVLACSLVTGRATVRDSIAALYDHVQATTRYLGLFSGEGGIIPAPAAQTHANGYGDCKGLATYLIALCRAVGIPAWPVLVLADDERPLATDIPNMGQFNHFITWADDRRGGCWLDPTLEGIPAGIVTTTDADKPVLMTRPGAEGLCLIAREAWDPGRRIVHVEGAVDATRRLKARVTLSASGPGGKVVDTHLKRLDAKRRDAALRDLMLAPNLRMVSTNAAPDATDTLPTWRRDVSAVAPLPSSPGALYVPAEIAYVSELHYRPEETAGIDDPAARPDRRESWRLEVPVGWSLAAPDSFTVSGPGLTWTRTVRQEGSALLLRRDVDWANEAVPEDQHDAAVKTLADAVARERAPLTLKGR